MESVLGLGVGVAVGRWDWGCDYDWGLSLPSGLLSFTFYAYFNCSQAKKFEGSFSLSETEAKEKPTNNENVAWTAAGAGPEGELNGS